MMEWADVGYAGGCLWWCAKGHNLQNMELIIVDMHFICHSGRSAFVECSCKELLWHLHMKLNVGSGIRPLRPGSAEVNWCAMG